MKITSKKIKKYLKNPFRILPVLYSILFQNRIQKILLSIIKSQKIWSYFHKTSLLGMNYGTGSNTNESGERWVIINVIKILKKENLVIFDVGANVGEYSKLITQTLNSYFDIYCFEPLKSTYNILVKNMLSLKLKNVHTYNHGFSDEEKIVNIFFDKEGSGLTSLYERNLNHFNIQMDKREEVELKTIDNFCQKNIINIIDFLKIDTEGSELEILKGAKNMISSNKINIIQFEFGGCNIDSKTYFKDFFYLLSPNYKIYRILKNGLWEIDRYSEREEIFTLANFLAISRSVKYQ